jgi:hypothetical protein
MPRRDLQGADGVPAATTSGQQLATIGQLTRPLRSGRGLAAFGLVVVLTAQALPPASVSGWLTNLVGVVLTTWGAVRVTGWVARLRGRRSLTETAMGIGLVGVADALTITVAQGPQDRVKSWALGIAAIGSGLLGLALTVSGALDSRQERRLINDSPLPDAKTPPGLALTESETRPLRQTLALTAVSLLTTLVIAFTR